MITFSAHQEDKKWIGVVLFGETPVLWTDRGFDDKRRAIVNAHRKLGNAVRCSHVFGETWNERGQTIQGDNIDYLCCDCKKCGFRSYVEIDDRDE